MSLSALGQAVDSFSIKQPSAVQAEPANGSDVLAQLRAGQVVLKIQQKSSWAQVFFMSDTDQPVKGWVPAKLLAAIGDVSYEPVASDVKAAELFNSKVNANSLRVRAGASTDFEVVGRLVKSQSVVRLKDADGWSNIRFKVDNVWREGWVASKYLAAK
ncbi:SH3 domain-containing protein [Aliamphritea ceti]|uniref:SH3 domain-containing protein n=1 Tax=Aliamphritea ceti TaxID=1524258 RepID=UPI0021C35269|nr:SH3 domain-containing protein [Aliamphritea ceti]